MHQRRKSSAPTPPPPADHLRPETAADFLDDTFAGIGPKQSRNLLQSLGLSRYEIPIDSRITKWLNAFGFPFHLTADGLADRHYFAVVSKGIRILCTAADVLRVCSTPLCS